MSLREEFDALYPVLDSFRTSVKFSDEFPEITKWIAQWQQRIEHIRMNDPGE